MPIAAFADTEPVYINEFMAKNESTLADGNGVYSDWIELYNSSDTPVSLTGWYLTDSSDTLTKWVFPEKSIGAHGYLVVFASGAAAPGYVDPAGYLHTTFKLAAEGEYLALVKPDGTTIASEFSPAYPSQEADVSFGLGPSRRYVKFLDDGTACRVIVPRDDSAGTAWRQQTGYDDSGWLAGELSVGYDETGGYPFTIRTDIMNSMKSSNLTAYVRVPFIADPADDAANLALHIMFDDGFVAYLNGTEIARANAPAVPAWNSGATANQTDEDAQIYHTFPVPGTMMLDSSGTNMLAIHGMNRAIASRDFLVRPVLDGFITDTSDRTTWYYFSISTPGAANGDGELMPSGPVTADPPGTVCTGACLVTLSAPDPDAIIVYTLDGSWPTTLSPVYTNPIQVTATVCIRAMAIEPGRAPGPVMSESYLFLDQAVQSYNANLPIVIVDNFGRGELLNDVQMDATFMLFDREQTGRADFSTVPNLSGDVHIKRRGSSTVIVDVIPSFNLEFVDGNNEDRDVNLLNFPPESDFIMYYPSVFDTSLINNSFVYALSCSNGVYAVKTRFVDVYLNTDGDDIEPADHIGVYVLMEKIKRGPDRVDVEKLEPEVVGGPEIAGGYMLKIDRPDPGDSGFHTTRGTPTFYCYFCYVYPKEGEMPAAQKTWIRNYLNQFESALYGSNFTDPQNGYVKYIDADSFIDHHILGDFSKDPDAFWLSTYMFKSRTGKLTMGPIWDFDRAFGFEGRSADPVGPVSFGDVQLPFNYDWWGRLFQDPDFMQKYIDRYFNLRDSSMSLAAMRAMVDSQAAELAESQAGNSSWPGNISRLKNWITARANFMDSIFIPRPAFGRPAGMVAPGTTVGLSGSGTIYYTLDGSDPRAPGGGVRSNALEYSGTPVSIPENVLITIRALSTTPAAPAGVLPWPSSADIAGKQWSAPRTALYAVATPDVAITEIMYNPREPADGTAETNFSGADFEFIELQNTADSVAQLTGVMIADGISFDFSYGAVRYVQPYEYVVAVKNPDAFAVRYPDWQDIHLAGTFEGKLDNAGEQLLLLTPVLQTNVLFSYDNAWYPQTDGGGYSLVKNNPGESTVDWGQKSGWRASGILDGTPGFPDEIPEPGAGVGFIVSLMIMNAKARRRGESRCPRAVSRCPMPDARGPRNHGSCVAAGE